MEPWCNQGREKATLIGEMTWRVMNKVWYVKVSLSQVWMIYLSY